MAKAQRKPKNADGVHVVRARLASGALAEYHYAWRGGPRILGAPGSPEYLKSLAAHLEGPKKRSVDDPETLSDLVTAYKASAVYRKLGKDSKRAYEAYFPAIINEFGDLPIEALENKRVRRHFVKWRDTMADNPRKADYAIGTLKRVLSWACGDVAYLDSNQAEPIGRLHSADKSDSIVSPDQLEAFEAVASDELKWAVRLGLYTGLRVSNLVRITWKTYDGQSISYRTTKRNVEVLIPLTLPAREMMKAVPKRAVTILTNMRTQTPWTTDGLRASFGKACAEAKVKFTFHALRRTACTHLLIQGIKVPQVAMIMGWSEADVEAMKRKYVSRAEVVAEIIAMMDRSVV